MTEPGETDGYSAADHVDALRRHGMRGVVDAVLVNDGPVSDDVVATYERHGARPVVIDESRIRQLGVKVVRAPVATDGGAARHDPDRLAEALLALM
jgi:2-phospho-L-lactate transferase/gluconeogenesis factor (CofD/UPF0052 family)